MAPSAELDPQNTTSNKLAGQSKEKRGSAPRTCKQPRRGAASTWSSKKWLWWDGIACCRIMAYE